MQWSTFYGTLKISKTSRRWHVQCQGIKVSKRVLDLLWKYDTNLSCKCRVSSGPRKPWNESSGPWNPWISYDTLPKTLKPPKYVFPWLSWRPQNLLFRKQNRINYQIRGKLWCKTLVGKQKFGPWKMAKN